jgi:hypothetical protein
MPFTGGACPSPERYGGGEGLGNKPLLQVVWESIAAARGSAYDQQWPPTTAVGYENMAIARAVCFDGYGANARLANNFQPGKMTATGLLPRWETVFGTPPNPGDPDSVRRARILAAWAKLGAANAIQQVFDVLRSTLGSLYTGIVQYTPTSGFAWWPGFTGSAASVTSTGPAQASGVTVSGEPQIPTPTYGQSLVLSNCATAANNGTFEVNSGLSGGVLTYINAAAVSPDYGVGGTAGVPTVQWSLVNPTAPWLSTIAQLSIQLNVPAGYGTALSPNALWWATVATCRAALDQLLPAWMTFDFFVLDSAGVQAFKLDENNLDLEALGS